MVALARGESLGVLAQRASVARQRAALARQGGSARKVEAVWSTPAPVVPSGCGGITAPELSRLIDSAAGANDLAPAIVREVVRQESAFNPCAVSRKGAEGLMQLMPGTQALLGVGDAFDPEESLMAGARLLKDLLGRYNGNLALALSAYNAGPKRVDQANGIPPIPETRDYVAKILSRLTD